MGKRHPNWRRIKTHRSYPTEGLARTLGIHKNTVRSWMRGGLRTVEERREKLRDLLPRDQRCAIQFSDHFEGPGTALFQKACAMGLEGIVSKRALSPYKSGPSKFW